VRRTGINPFLRCSLLTLPLAISPAHFALADVSLFKSNSGWEWYTNGRVNVFLSWAAGDGMPVAPLNSMGQPSWQYAEAGGTGAYDSDSANSPVLDSSGNYLGYAQGTINSMRIRSGFVGNVIGFGVKHSWGDSQLVS
jgi:hypothetical protein